MTHSETALQWLALRLPKRGHTDAECEDAWAAEPIRGCYAIADGASESAFASVWARLLVDGFVTAPRPGELGTWLDIPRRDWSAEVTGRELPWYLEEKRKQGAFAALLGLTLRTVGRGRRSCHWRATAVGDCCLAWVRQNCGIQSFPLQKSSDFDNDPRLICSRIGAWPNEVTCSGSLIPGDRLFLMTDALAQWFLRSHENAGRPWEALAEVLSSESPEDAFAVWIENLRRTDGMRDDDVTLIALTAAALPQERGS